MLRSRSHRIFIAEVRYLYKLVVVVSIDCIYCDRLYLLHLCVWLFSGACLRASTLWRLAFLNALTFCCMRAHGLVAASVRLVRYGGLDCGESVEDLVQVVPCTLQGLARFAFFVKWGGLLLRLLF